jgi:alpha-1,3-mannosyltransferase
MLDRGELMLDTKIDWPAYMQQVSGFRDGERDYTKLEGDTGPLVYVPSHLTYLTTRYPALHLYIYTLLQKFLPTSEHLQVRSAQYFFLGIYLITFNLVSGIYYLASRSSHKKLPQALLIPLVLSKRLHSIYLLRLFNDPLAMVFLYAGVGCWMLGGLWGAAGTILYA